MLSRRVSSLVKSENNIHHDTKGGELSFNMFKNSTTPRRIVNEFHGSSRLVFFTAVSEAESILL